MILLLNIPGCKKEPLIFSEQNNFQIIDLLSELTLYAQAWFCIPLAGVYVYIGSLGEVI